MRGSGSTDLGYRMLASNIQSPGLEANGLRGSNETWPVSNMMLRS